MAATCTAKKFLSCQGKCELFRKSGIATPYFGPKVIEYNPIPVVVASRVDRQNALPPPLFNWSEPCITTMPVIL